MFQKIIAFFKSLFGGKKRKPAPTSTNTSTAGTKQTSGTKTKTNTPPPTTTAPQVEKPIVKEPVNFTPPTATLYLGCFDKGVDRAKITALLKIYHQRMSGIPDSVKYTKFRHGDLTDWVDPKEVAGNPVAVLQGFLRDAELLPADSNIDGIFDYTTQAGVRLFQEYIRTIDKDTSIGIPDGVIGKNGWKHVKKWKEAHKTAKAWKRGQASAEYNKWINLMGQARKHYQNNSHIILDKVNAKVAKLGMDKVDTLSIDHWKVEGNHIHLIGIRRKEEKREKNSLRKNDDLFILLIDGMVFKFWGSTDPNYKAKSRKDEAFLVEGQHKFRFGWHNRSVSNQKKVYQGLNPYNNGVLVFRDRDNDDKLTDADIISKGIDEAPNNTINIHWTGAGQGASGTWSAGCQVFAGKNYINNNGDLIDCSKFAAIGSADLKNNASAASLSKTKAAYNMFTDLLILYRPKNIDYLYYTLGRDDIFAHKFVVDLSGDDILSDTLKVFDLPDDLV